MKRINFHLTDEMHQDFKMKCIANGYTMTEMLNTFVRDYLERN